MVREGARLAEVFPGANWVRSDACSKQGLDLWYALPRGHSARPRLQLTVCCAPQEHRPALSAAPMPTAGEPLAAEETHRLESGGH